MGTGKASSKVAPSGITPDEVLLLRRRQEWRRRVLAICITFLKELKEDDLATYCLGDQGELWLRFQELSPEIERDAQRLLESQMVAPELEMHRHGANYFLDTLIRMLREGAEERARQEGRRVAASGPLAEMDEAALTARVRELFARSPDAIPVFLNDLVNVEQFEIEVQLQRRRLQFLLGSDRALRDLAESNADIFEATDEAFGQIVRQFFAICEAIESKLGPLLELESPYPKLQRELESSREQLGWLVSRIFGPSRELRGEVESLQERLSGLRGALRRLQVGASELRTLPMPRGDESERLAPAAIQVRDLERVLAEVKGALGELSAGSWDEPLASDREELQEPWQRFTEVAPELRAELEAIEPRVVDPALEVLIRARRGEETLQLGALKRLQGLVGDRLSTLNTTCLSAAVTAVEEVAQRSLKRLKERICQELGFVRTSFLQPSFAHIAAEDPRSLHTAQYFYLKEFAEEAERSQQLLQAAHTLWQELERAQSTRIQGLRFTANNLKKIAERVLLERRTVPSGVGWHELATFLSVLKDNLVPRLRMICAQPGVRFDDKDQLTRYASEISDACGMLLAQRETAHTLMGEVAGVGSETGGDIREQYEEIILRVTCEDMAVKLQRVSKTLVELVPYVGAMVGSIRMRTSLSFGRQPDSGGEEGDSGRAPADLLGAEGFRQLWS